MNIVGSKIKARRKALDLSADYVADKLGISRATLYRYEGAANPKIPMAIMTPLSEVLKTTPEYLLGIDDAKSQWIAENTIPISKVTYLPIIGVVRAGAGGIAFEDNLGEEFIETEFLKGHSPNEFFWSRVKGDSMEPRLFEGDLVLVRKQQSVDSGAYAVVLVDDEEGVVKRVTYTEDSITLHSQNHNYPPRVFYGKDVLRLRIVGQVVKSMSTF